MRKDFQNVNVATVAVDGTTSNQCSLVQIRFYENAKDFSVKYEGTGILKGPWCYLKDNANLTFSKKRVSGKHFKILKIIENYPSDFDITKWQHEGESDIVKSNMSHGSAILDQIDGIDKDDILAKLKDNQCIRADVAYTYGRDNKHYRYETDVVLCGNRCYLCGGSTKIISGINFKIVKVYDSFPDTFKFSYYLNRA